jgi:hypothetical protein
MTAPIQEPTEGRSISGLGYGARQLFRRPAPVEALPIAERTYELEYNFGTTQYDFTTIYDMYTNDLGVFDPGAGSIDALVDGTYLLSLWGVMILNAGVLGGARTIPGEASVVWAVESGFGDNSHQPIYRSVNQGVLDASWAHQYTWNMNWTATIAMQGGAPYVCYPNIQIFTALVASGGFVPTVQCLMFITRLGDSVFNFPSGS